MEVLSKDQAPWMLIVPGRHGVVRRAAHADPHHLQSAELATASTAAWECTAPSSGAAVAAAGAFMNFQASGGDIKDLTDVDKLKASFSKGATTSDDMPPPPPPPPPAPPTT
jgi:hypothetical protein